MIKIVEWKFSNGLNFGIVPDRDSWDFPLTAFNEEDSSWRSRPVWGESWKSYLHFEIRVWFFLNWPSERLEVGILPHSCNVMRLLVPDTKVTIVLPIHILSHSRVLGDIFSQLLFRNLFLKISFGILNAVMTLEWTGALVDRQVHLF